MEEAKVLLARIDRFHMGFYARVVERLKAAGLLDSTTLVMGSGISDGDRHNYADLQVFIAVGGWRPGHFHYEGKRPLADLWLAMARKAGTNLERFADSTSSLDEVVV